MDDTTLRSSSGIKLSVWHSSLFGVGVGVDVNGKQTIRYRQHYVAARFRPFNKWSAQMYFVTIWYIHTWCNNRWILAKKRPQIIVHAECIGVQFTFIDLSILWLQIPLQFDKLSGVRDLKSFRLRLTFSKIVHGHQANMESCILYVTITISCWKRMSGWLSRTDFLGQRTSRSM